MNLQAKFKTCEIFIVNLLSVIEHTFDEASFLGGKLTQTSSYIELRSVVKEAFNLVATDLS
jgi:hypothetical protein